MTKKELQELLDNNDIGYPPDATKSDLFDILEDLSDG